MRLVYKFNNYENNDRLFKLCRYSKDLYNQALYIINTNLKENNRFIFYNELNTILQHTKNLENEINYRKLKAQVSQQCLKVLDKNIKSYIKSIKDYSKNKEKYKGVPKLPKYKKKNGYNQLIYTNQACKITDGYIHFSKTLKIKIPQYEKYKDKYKKFNQVRVNPKTDYTEIEIIYEDNSLTNNNLDYNRYASIDLGLDNLVTMITDFSNPIIYSGKQIKSKNQYYNKKIAKYKSLVETNNKHKSSKRIKRLWDKRDKALDDIFHKVSRNITKLLTKNGTGNLVIGHNNGWKDSINNGKVNNPNFVQVPFDKLISFLKYKCEMVGIKVTENEESYTSKCDGLALEKICKHKTYLGKRKKRGLFQHSVGKLINADVNGALNILRKVVGDSEIISKIINSGWLFQPKKFNNIYALNMETVKVLQ